MKRTLTVSYLGLLALCSPLCSALLNDEQIGVVHSPMAIKSVIDTTGRVFAVWEAALDGFSVIQSNFMVENGVWNTPMILSDVKSFGTKPEIAIDLHGNVGAIWAVYDPSVQADYLVASFLPAGGEWSKPTKVSSLNEYGICEYRVKSSSSGLFMVTWKACDATTKLYHFSSATCECQGPLSIQADIFSAP